MADMTIAGDQASTSDLRARASDDAYAEALRHSRKVHILKIVLPSIAATIGFSFFAYSYIITPSKVIVSISDRGIVDGKLVMAKPKLDGFTRDKLPYKMTAERAIQAVGNTDRIELEGIDATVPLNAENTAKIKSPSGVFDNVNNRLDITDDTTIVTSDGLQAWLKSAAIDLATRNVTTDDPVTIKMDGSTITANTMSVSEGGKVLVFKDRVRINMKPRNSADKEK